MIKAFGLKEHGVNEGVLTKKKKQQQNILYIEVLTAFEDTLSPVTLKIFDQHLFAPHRKHCISVYHSITHTHADQSSAITFLHLNHRSFIFSVQVYSEVLFLPMPLLITLSSPLCLLSLRSDQRLSGAAT